MNLFFYKNADVSQKLKKCQVFVLEDCFFPKTIRYWDKMSEFTNIYQVWESSGHTISPGARWGKDEPFLKFFSKIKKTYLKMVFKQAC